MEKTTISIPDFQGMLRKSLSALNFDEELKEIKDLEGKQREWRTKRAMTIANLNQVGEARKSALKKAEEAKDAKIQKKHLADASKLRSEIQEHEMLLETIESQDPNVESEIDRIRRQMRDKVGVILDDFKKTEEESLKKVSSELRERVATYRNALNEVVLNGINKDLKLGWTALSDTMTLRLIGIADRPVFL